MKKTGWWIALGALLFAALLAYSTLRLRQHRVEVCIAFNGRTECRTASGASEQEAIRTATENACALIASGMTESIACERTPPQSVRRLDGR
jgi:hypothetical protein